MQPNALRPFGLIALFSLILAASAGVILRFGLVNGMPDWAPNYIAVRHAHSHLMFFGWATLAIMGLIWRGLTAYTRRPLPPGVKWQMTGTAALALLSFPAFWVNGYGLTQVGPLSLPLGSMVAGLNVVTWAWFGLLYLGYTRGLAWRPLPVQLWDWALLLLAVASLGALGLVAALAVPGGVSLTLQQAFLHLFLDLFTYGWLILSGLGLIWHRVGLRASLPANLPVPGLALAIAPLFLLGMSPILVPPGLFQAAIWMNGIVALLLGWHGVALWQRRAHLPVLGRVALFSLAVHGVIGIILLWPGLWQWGSRTQLPVFVLHNLLLGWLSSLLLGLLMEAWGKVVWRQGLGMVWAVSLWAMLLPLLGIGLIPLIPIPAPSLLWAAAWSSLALLAAASLAGIREVDEMGA